jgi:hypothetical protein
MIIVDNMKKKEFVIMFVIHLILNSLEMQIAMIVIQIVRLVPIQ